MKRFVLPFIVAAPLLAPLNVPAQVEYVDPAIGGVGLILEPTRPTVHLPNSMVRVYPIRKDQLDDYIQSFPLTIISHRLGELFSLMPSDGGMKNGSPEVPAAYDQETLTPYYYSTRFDRSLVRTEFTPTERCGYFRFSFPSGKGAVVLGNRFPGELSAIGDRAVSGLERFQGMQAFCYGEFNLPVRFQTNRDSEKKRMIISAPEGAEQLEFRYGISFISIDQARKNLETEIAGSSFDKVKAKARDRWNTVLGQVEVKGGTLSQRRTFYTALYRCYERMINITEDGRYYSGYDHAVHEDSRPFYVDNWLWDTYRALEPLHTLLNPDVEADKLQSYARMYEQLGWMPQFAVLYGNHPCMTGNPAAPWIADAWLKGVRNFDVKTAYAGVRKNSLEGTWLPWRRGAKGSLDDFLNEHGYLPSLQPGEKETVAEVHPFERRQAVAVTLAQSYDDWCTAQLAKSLGKGDDYQLFLRRAANYTNVFRVEKSRMWPRDARGQWVEPFDPKFSGGQGGRDYFTENNSYTYDWDVQHDLQGLFNLMGGTRKAETKLDQLFSEGLGRSKYEFWSVFPDSTGLVGQFSMGNEPSLAIPYLYNHLGAPWKTQKRIRMLLETWFPDTVFGIPGDEDGGGMSAFVVFSMLGFYPVSPGVPVYDVGSPVFDRATIHLRGGKTIQIIARNNSRQNKYIQSLKLNGKPMQQVWFRHADIVNGGTLELQMSNTPNKDLGALPATFPPSAMNLDPSTLASAEYLIGASKE